MLDFFIRFKIITIKKQILHNQEDLNSWKNYSGYIEELIATNLKKLIVSNLAFLCQNIDVDISDYAKDFQKLDLETGNKINTHPFFECQLALQSCEMMFMPSIDGQSKAGIKFKTNGIIQNIINQASGVSKIDSTDKKETFKFLFIIASDIIIS